jgi:acetone carboxylase gamma subunit
MTTDQNVAPLHAVADEAQPAREPDDTVHACPGRWGGPDCACFDTVEAAVPDRPVVGGAQQPKEARP